MFFNWLESEINYKKHIAFRYLLGYPLIHSGVINTHIALSSGIEREKTYLLPNSYIVLSMQRQLLPIHFMYSCSL